VPPLVAIGASAGGLHALSVILQALPASFPASIAIVQHRRADESSLLRDLLARKTCLPVLEPCHGTPIRPGHVYLAPPDYHLLVEPGYLALSVDPPSSCSRPSIDVLFESVAAAYRRQAIGVVLTGANADGARGALLLSQVGAPVIVQDPASAESPTCPAAALARAPQASVLGLSEIAARLVATCGAAGSQTGPVAALQRGPTSGTNRAELDAARRGVGRKCRP
jgi:two-component system, chemotaxis family, protein-glutamate methylesterase/glutaminase